jgi:hypothetical protein
LTRSGEVEDIESATDPREIAPCDPPQNRVQKQPAWKIVEERQGYLSETVHRASSQPSDRASVVERAEKPQLAKLFFIEQTLFFGVSSIRGEQRAIFSELGRNHMKLRLAMLIWVGVLLTAAPAWADRVPCCNLGKEAPAGFSADFEHGLDAKSPLPNVGSGRFVADDTFFSPSVPAEGVSNTDLRDLGGVERYTDHTARDLGRDWFDGGSKEHDAEGSGSGSTPVPEPASLALLLVGLTVVGVFARKR